MTRPTSYSQETAEAICDRLAEGESLRSICRDDAMPARGMVLRWLKDNTAFRVQYACAREIQAETLTDDIIDIADAATDSASVAAARVRIDARKWLARQLAPKKYGDAQRVEVTTITQSPASMSDEELAASLRRRGLPTHFLEE